MVSFPKLINASLAVFLTVLITACNSSSDGSSSLSLALTDAPVDGATGVVVEFTGVELKRSGGPAFSIDFDAPRQIDLLALQGTDAANLLDNVEVEADSYQWMRLKVNAEANTMDSFISFEDGSSFSLTVPSGSETGLKLVRGFVVTQGSHASFVIDFDLRKSVVDPVGQVNDYFLKPALRLIDNNEAGHIQGTVTNATAELEVCSNGVVVYVYEGLDIVADDEGSPTSPLTSANVEFNNADNTYGYTVGYLTPMDYTLAITCQAADDLAESDEDIEFIASINATVVADQTTTANFE
jgi:hypothetical protein